MAIKTSTAAFVSFRNNTTNSYFKLLEWLNARRTPFLPPLTSAFSSDSSPVEALRYSCLLTAGLLITAAVVSFSFRLVKYSRSSPRYLRPLTSLHAWATEGVQVLLALLCYLHVVGGLACAFDMLQEDDITVDTAISTAAYALYTVFVLSLAFLQAGSVYLVDIIEARIFLGRWRHPYDSRPFVLLRCKVFGMQQTWKTPQRATATAMKRTAPAVIEDKISQQQTADEPRGRRRTGHDVAQSITIARQQQTIVHLYRLLKRTSRDVKQLVDLVIRLHIDPELYKKYTASSEEAQDILLAGMENPALRLAMVEVGMMTPSESGSMAEGLSPDHESRVPVAVGEDDWALPTPPDSHRKTGWSAAVETTGPPTQVVPWPEDSDEQASRGDVADKTEKPAILNDTNVSGTSPAKLDCGPRARSLPPKLFERLTNESLILDDSGPAITQHGLSASRPPGIDAELRSCSLGTMPLVSSPLKDGWMKQEGGQTAASTATERGRDVVRAKVSKSSKEVVIRALKTTVPPGAASL